MIKSQDDLNKCNDGKRSSEVLLQTIEKCERLQKQLDIAIEGLKKYESGRYIFTNNNGVSSGSMNLAADGGETARQYLKKIQELNK